MKNNLKLIRKNMQCVFELSHIFGEYFNEDETWAAFNAISTKIYEVIDVFDEQFKKELDAK
jgi:hypothetical protein